MGEGTVSARLKGKVNGVSHEITASLVLAKDGRNAFLPRIWAQRKIGFLLDEIRQNGEKPELKDEVVRLARAFGIPTPYTSWLVLDESELRRRNGAGVARGAADDGFRRLMGEAKKTPTPGRAEGAPAAPTAASASEYSSGGSLAKAEATGEDAARDGKRITSLEKGDKDTDEARSKIAGLSTEAIRDVIRQVGPRTFYGVDGVWVDSSVDETARKGAKKVAYLSDAYFELLAAHPEASPFFALGSKVVVKLGADVFEVTD